MNFTEVDRKKNSDIDLIKKIIVIMNLIFEKDNIDIDSLFEYVLYNDCGNDTDAEDHDVNDDDEDDDSDNQLFDEYTMYIKSLLSLLSNTDVSDSIEFNIKHICGSYLCDGITGLETIGEIVGFSSFFSDFLISTIKNQPLFEKIDLTLEDLIQNFTFKDINWNINKKYHNTDDERMVLDRNNYARDELTKMLSYYKKNSCYV
jgi:hypothetical protein